MGSTILDIAREACERDNTAPPPTTLFGDQGKVARTLRTACKDTVREYLRLVNFTGTSENHSTWHFVLRPNRAAYNLPPDFLRIIPRTEHRNGWEMGLIGPADPVTWARWLSGAGSVTAPMGWRVKNNMLLIEPTPTAREIVSIDYISRYPVVSALQPGDYNLSSNPMMVNAPFVARDGYLDIDRVSDVVPQNDQVAEYENSETGYDVGHWPSEISEILHRINPNTGVGPVPMVRRPEFTSDTDMPVWEDDHLFSLGLTYRLRRGLGLPFDESAAEYEAEMDTKGNTDSSPRSFSIGGEQPQAETVPLGGGRWMLS